MTAKRSNIFLADEDRTAIHTVRERYGLSTDSDALRLAIRVLAASPKLALPKDWQPRPNWQRQPKPKGHST